MALFKRIPMFVERGSRQPPETLICFCHLRWNFVYQRPQHLMARFAANRRVLYVEEPIGTTSTSFLNRTIDVSGVEIIVPHLREGSNRVEELRELLDRLIAERAPSDYVFWYYTPMA